MKSDGSRRHFGGPAGKESKMRKKKSLIILAVALVVLLGVYLGLQAWNRHSFHGRWNSLPRSAETTVQ